MRNSLKSQSPDSGGSVNLCGYYRTEGENKPEDRGGFSTSDVSKQKFGHSLIGEYCPRQKSNSLIKTLPVWQRREHHVIELADNCNK